MTKAQQSNTRLLSKGIHLSLVNLWRNRFLSVASIIVIATIVFIFNIILSINYNVQSSITDLNQKVDLTIYVQDKEPSELQELVGEIKSQEGVVEAKIIWKTEALDQVKALHPETADFLAKYEIENPLPNSISISTKDPKYHEEIRSYLQANFPNLISSINENNTEQIKRTRQITENLKGIQNFANQIMFWIVIVFVFGGSLIIINALQVSIYSRQKEVSIMRFIGASHNFIRLPYVLEAVWYAILAVLLNLVMLLFLNFSISENAPALTLWTSNDAELTRIIFLEFLITIVLSIVSSFIAIEGHLRKKLL